MFWTFNFYPAHSSGFFVKKKVHNEVGNYSLKFPCSSDYDFFWRLIKKIITKEYQQKKMKLLEFLNQVDFHPTTVFLNIFGKKLL